MKQQALGMIETYGLTAAVEAADIALKTAAVELVGYEKVKGGRIMIAVAGEVAAVQAAVAAGSAAAGKVNTVLGRHVIPRPIADIGLMIYSQDKGPEPPWPTGGSPGPGSPAEESAEVARQVGEESVQSAGDLADLSVMELRRLARKTDGLAIKGREISRANKEQLIAEIMRVRNLK